ncbi:hypothetical protein BA895_06305 [Humibacillus sp. DSM 29435]|uniref:VC0807 family protein n=1 Tax=Humibacillus sp. DSM 29435 TaxID=1869167 RepID=UPI0008724812|nr:VC0807 family protein [Humibacillus sp. DSM 29435]OFE15336.1 hypothetical protein BA895_06305 [Humibacillus sp. DSM 29435]
MSVGSLRRRAGRATETRRSDIDQSDHDEIARTLAVHPARKGVVFNVALTALEVGGAIGLFQLAKAGGGDDVQAYLAGSVAPVLGAAVVWVRSRKFSGASAAIFAFTALSVVVALVGSTDPRVLLYKDCATTAAVGVVCAASCVLMARPVMFYFVQRYGSDGTREGMAVFDRMWVVYPGFRRSMFHVTIVWAVVFLVQAVVMALIIASTSFATAYGWDQILPIVALVVALSLSVTVGRHAQRTAGAQRIGTAGH